jgi:hypothetical protein
VVAPSASHASSRGDRWASLLTSAFFAEPTPPRTDLSTLIERIEALPDVRMAEPHLFRLARVAIMFADGATIRRFDAVPGIALLFVADAEGRCVYAGGAPWTRRRVLRQAVHAIVHELGTPLLYPARSLNTPRAGDSVDNSPDSCG